MNQAALARINDLNVKLYADGADFASMVEMAKLPYISGFTTNPSFMRKSGIADYEEFGREILQALPNHPVSLEVFADTLPEMEQQGRYIATWGENVNVKIPITTTKGEFTGPVIERLSNEGIVLNVTALMTFEQVKLVEAVLAPQTGAIISVFAGRVADSGVDPMPEMQQAAEFLQDSPLHELLWASTRETLNIFQADQCGCKIITVPHGILRKLDLVGKDLDEYSLDTVITFYNDAQNAGYELAV